MNIKARPSLERYRLSRLVIQHGRTSAHDAAKAMEANHIGAVLVQDHGELRGIVTDRDLALRVVAQGLDAGQTLLEEIMTRELATLPPSAIEQDAAELMQNHGIRRVPLVEHDRVVGLVTLDDLMLAGGSELRLLIAAIRLQLEAGAARKPAGLVHPVKEATSASAREHDPADDRFGRLVNIVKKFAFLESRDAAEKALEIVLAALVQRITPEEAADLIAQLPSRLHDRLVALPEGPDRRIDQTSVESALAEQLELDGEEAARVAHGVGLAIAQVVSEGELEDVRSQLPRSMHEILPSAGL
jgi:CBS domain-containing protein/uncharacterized protein (DUF2267 family)